jgi:hypothetical protein
VPPILLLPRVPTSQSLNHISWSSWLAPRVVLPIQGAATNNVTAAAATSTAANPMTQGATKSSTATAASTATDPTSQGVALTTANHCRSNNKSWRHQKFCLYSSNPIRVLRQPSGKGVLPTTSMSRCVIWVALITPFAGLPSTQCEVLTSVL